MSSDRAAFFKKTGYIIQLPGYMALLTTCVAIIYNEYLAIIPFVSLAVLTLAIGGYIVHRSPLEEEASIANPVKLAALSYGLVSVIGALPLYATAAIFNSYGTASSELMNLYRWLNALFESFAGFSSSGLTMINNPEQIPHVIQFWRSVSQWLGGLGVIFLVIFIFTPQIEGMKKLIATEVGNIGIEDDIPEVARNVGFFYLGFTLLAFILYLFADQTVWVSLNHALTSVSTGGFNVTNESFDFQPLDSKLISLILLIIGAMGFGFHNELVMKRNSRAFQKYRENFWFLMLLFSGVVFMILDSWFSNNAPSVIDNVYQWISALTTSGYQTADVEHWEDWRLFILSLAMLVGGVGGSTAGGLKVRRVLLIASIMLSRLIPYKREKFEEKIIIYGEGEDFKDITFNVITLLGLWLFMLFASVIIIASIVSDEYGLAAVFFEVVSAQSNVGLSTGLTGADAHWFIKADFILLMWMGRLELVAVAFSFLSWFKRG